MIGFDVLAVSGLLTMTSAGITCTQTQPPEINIVPSKSEIVYNNSRATTELSQADIDTVSPYSPDHTTTVGGLMSGQIEVKSTIYFAKEIYRQSQVGCVSYDKIDVRLNIDPTIFIARDFPPGSCKYEAIRTHELKHVYVDGKIVNKYAQLIGNAVVEALNKDGYNSGVVGFRDLDQAQTNMETRVKNAINAVTTAMYKERQAAQQAIDSLKEYERVNAMCKE